jgi:trimeric autotransporter adhesin
LKPFPQYTFVQSDVALRPIGKASYHSLQIKATKRFSQGLSGLFFFTWAKSLTNASGGSTTYANFAEGSRQYPGSNPTSIDPGVPAAIFGLNFSYDLPFGKGKRFLASASRLVDSILGG